MLGQQSKFRPNLNFISKNRNLGQKISFRSKKNRNLGQKSKY